MEKLKIVLPKGSLQENTIKIFQKAGIKIYLTERSYKPICDDEELDITFLRAQEIPKPVEEGIFDCGITGYDWICEKAAKVKKICELVYSKSEFKPIKWVLATKKDYIRSINDLQNKRIVTELKNVTEKFFKKRKIDVIVESSWGTTEVLADFYDAIVELTETGTTLKQHGLRIIETVLVSTPWFITNDKSWENRFKREKMEALSTLLTGALLAENMVGLKMNLEKNNLKKVLKLLPALKKPTISPLTLKNWVAVEVVVEEKKAKELVPKLKKAGAQGIIEYPLNKVIL